MIVALIVVTSFFTFGRARADSTPAPDDCGDAKSCARALYHTVATRKPRAELSKFLVGPAQRASKARDWGKAIPLYQALVVARGAGSAEARELATLWTLAGQNEPAADAWRDYAAAVGDPVERERAEAEASRLAGASDPFADKLTLVEQITEARRAFTAGRAAFAARQYGDALVYYHMGNALAPDLPGFFRELGATYDRLGAAQRKLEFYLRYLVQRPFGSNADLVRGELAKDKAMLAVLGTLKISASMPCTEMWINGQRAPARLPEKGILAAPGNYRGLCFNPRFSMVLFEYATVEPGKPAALAFRWSIVENRLEHPLGRITLENAKAPGVMIDLGVSSPEVGVAAPADGRKLRMILKDDSGVRTVTRMVQIDPGQRLVVKW